MVANRNATGMAQRFRDLAGLKLILLQELDGMKAARAQLLQPLRQLTADCQQPREALILQASPSAGWSHPAVLVCLSCCTMPRQQACGSSLSHCLGPA